MLALAVAVGNSQSAKIWRIMKMKEFAAKLMAPL